MQWCTNAQHRVRNNAYTFELDHDRYKNGHLLAQGLCRKEEEKACHKQKEESEVHSWKIKRCKHHRYFASVYKVAERTGKSTSRVSSQL